MKIIEGMKEIKRHQVAITDLVGKIKQHCAHMDYEKSPYQDAPAQVVEWQQSVHDRLKEIERLRLAIQRTNLSTPVAIEVGGTGVTKTIAAWVLRRRDLAKLEMESWTALSDRGLKDGFLTTGATGTQTKAVVVRHYSASLRDAKVEALRNEPMQIDAALEVVNAVTDLVEVTDTN